MSSLNGEFQLPREAPVFSNINVREAVPQNRQETAQTRVQNACLERTLDHDNETVNPNVENSCRNKRRKVNSKSSKGRKLTSKVWDDFTKYKDKEGNDRARCKHCKNVFDGSSINGTTHLRNHLASCRSSKDNEGEEDKQADQEKVNITNPVVLQDKFVINQELNKLGVVRAIIKYGFSKINFIKPDILHVYAEEKEKLGRYLTELSCRFSLTIQHVDDGLLMVLHFINDHWELKQKFISFHLETDSLSLQDLNKSLLDLCVDKNICSVIVGFDTKIFGEEISNWLTVRGSLPFYGCLLSVSCLKYSIERFIRSSGKSMTAGRIGECFADAFLMDDHFQTAVENAKSKGNKVTSRSISTLPYGLEGLAMAVGFKKVLYALEQIYSGFKPVNLTKEEWDDEKAVHVLLKELDDAVCSLTVTKCPTANVFFPNICDIYSKLLALARSGNHHVRQMAEDEVADFLQYYWRHYKLVLAIAVFLDPRFKMDIIELWYGKIYGNNAAGEFKEICDGVKNVYREYFKSSSEMLDEWGVPMTSPETSDLDLYLKDTKVPSVRKFDILNWWHENASKYPTLARMARDFLAVPISSSALTNSSWYPEIKEITSCNALDDDLKSYLICTKFWLESPENYVIFQS